MTSSRRRFLKTLLGSAAAIALPVPKAEHPHTPPPVDPADTNPPLYVMTLRGNITHSTHSFDRPLDPQWRGAGPFFSSDRPTRLPSGDWAWEWNDDLDRLVAAPFRPYEAADDESGEDDDDWGW